MKLNIAITRDAKDIAVRREWMGKEARRARTAGEIAAKQAREQLAAPKPFWARVWAWLNA